MVRDGNFISEWFGHRIFPTVRSAPQSLTDQRTRRCPFLSAVKGRNQECIKSEFSKGVCTISSASNGPRQDWSVCPYRVFDSPLVPGIAERLFGAAKSIHLVPAPQLEFERRRLEVLEALRKDERVLVFFDQKVGGEIQLSATRQSPQMAFDITVVELVLSGDLLGLGQFAIVEIQTMDFHGSYRRAVKNLKDALRLHGEAFPEEIGAKEHWLSEGIEGPNIANVFKRTFYQLMFKFEIALSETCAGCALALPVAVWDSWQKFLGAPELEEGSDGVYRLANLPAAKEQLKSWIFLFDFDHQDDGTPSPVVVRKVIQTSAEALSEHALDRAPEFAIRQLQVSLYPTLVRRLQCYWPVDFVVPG